MNDINDGSILDATKLTELVQRQQVLLEEQRAELEALRAELRTLAVPAGAPLTQTNFRATGPGIGFLALVDRSIPSSGMTRGLVGVGTPGITPIENTIGVVGITASPDFDILNGKGVVGLTAGGTGVVGHDSGDGTGIRGISDRGTGVEGVGGIGIRGFGSGSGSIGVWGDADGVSVLGGVPVGRFFQPGAGRVKTGVMGTGAVDTEDLDYAYAGWFDAINGTAPLHLEPSQNPQPPAAAQRGDLFVSSTGALWFCTSTGDNSPNPATWRQVQLV